MKGIVLASGSAIRRQLLEAAGVRFTHQPADMDEQALLAELRAAGASVPAIAVALAAAKAEAVSQAHPQALVIGADQILCFQDQPLSKAPSLSEARDRLLRQRGGEHSLIGGLALARGGETLWKHEAATRIRLRDFSEAFLDAYLAEVGEPVLASVCCYEIEGRGAQLIERIDGDYFSALGLPLLPLLEALRREGALPV